MTIARWLRGRPLDMLPYLHPLLEQAMGKQRQIKLGFILHGVGRTWNDCRHPDRDVNASTSFAY